MLKPNFITREDTKDKYIFWDIDGVLAPFRFNGKLSYPRDSMEGIHDIEEGMYRLRQPSHFMQDVVRTCGAKKQIIMGHMLEEQEVIDKEVWLKEYFPEISEYIWKTTDVSKGKTIIDYCKGHGIDLSDIIFVDDTHYIIQEAEMLGIPAWHISSFLDWFIR